MADRILLRGGRVLTVDPELGDIAGGDVLIEGDTIVQVGKDISAEASSAYLRDVLARGKAEEEAS
jgi:cytosine/adenosine deaminase-related metal-dependent hydrolase